MYSPTPVMMQAVHTRLPAVAVPSVRLDLTSRRVMTMQWMDGERPADLMLIAQGADELATFEERKVATQKLLRLVRINK